MLNYVPGAPLSAKVIDEVFIDAGSHEVDLQSFIKLVRSFTEYNAAEFSFTCTELIANGSINRYHFSKLMNAFCVRLAASGRLTDMKVVGFIDRQINKGWSTK